MNFERKPASVQNALKETNSALLSALGSIGGKRIAEIKRKKKEEEAIWNEAFMVPDDTAEVERARGGDPKDD